MGQATARPTGQGLVGRPAGLREFLPRARLRPRRPRARSTLCSWSPSPRVRPPSSAPHTPWCSTPWGGASANETNHTQCRSHHPACHHRSAWGSNRSSSAPALRDAWTTRCGPLPTRPCFPPPLPNTCLPPPGSRRKLRWIGSGNLCRVSAGTYASRTTRHRSARPPRLRPSAPPIRAATRGRRHRRHAPRRCLRRHRLEALAESRRRVPRCGHRSSGAARRRVWRPPRPGRLRSPPRRRRRHPMTTFATAIRAPLMSRWSACDG